MATREVSKQGVPVYRTFDGDRFHWIGSVHKTREAAQKTAREQARRFNANWRVVELPRGGFAPYLRYRHI